MKGFVTFLVVVFLLATAGMIIFGCMWTVGIYGEWPTFADMLWGILPGALLIAFLAAVVAAVIYLVVKWLINL